MHLTPDPSNTTRAGPARRDAPSAALAGATILVVEDEALVAHDLAATIRDSGGSVEGPICRLSEAMAYSDVGRLNAALLDVDIAGAEVFAFADRLKAGGVPIVFHTARADLAAVAERYPGAPVVCKPCLPRRLVATLASMLQPATGRPAAF